MSDNVSEGGSNVSYNSRGEKKLIHHEIAKVNTSQALTSWISLRDFKWMLSGTSWIMETQTYYLFGMDNSFVMVQMGYSNLTWPNNSCQVTARYYRPGNETSGGVKQIHKFETQTLSSMRMKLADDNRSASAQTSSITMKSDNSDLCKISTTEMNGDRVSFKIDFSINSQTADQKPPFALNLEFTPYTSPFKVCDGKVYFGANRNDGYIEMKFIPSGKCTGTVKIDDEIVEFHGVGMCMRQYQGVKPHVSTKRWNLAYFQEKPRTDESLTGRALFMIQMHCTESYNDEIVHYGYHFDGAKLFAVTGADSEITYSKTITDQENGYRVPEHFEYKWKGVDFDGKDFAASLSGTPTSRMARIDLLENVPSMLRRILENITAARPYIYQHFDEDVVAVINGESVTGNLFQEFSFLLEDPQFNARNSVLSAQSSQ